MTIQFKTEFNKLDIDAIVEVYHSVGWLGHHKDNVQKLFAASTHYVFAYDDQKVIGFARALSDGLFNAAIYDVVVHKSYQGNGIARSMLEQLLNEFNHLSCIHLISTTGNESFYKKLGFKSLKTGMAIYHKEHLANEYLFEED